MKTIVIFYEHISREFQSCVNLKNELEKNKDLSVYVLSYHFQIYDFYLLSKRRKIDLIILPYAYKLKSISVISFALKKNDRPIIVNFHHEQIGALYNEHRLFPHDEITKNKIIHLVWTNYFSDKLKECGVIDDNIYVVGNIRSDIIVNNKINNKQRFADEFSLSLNKKWIIYTESGVDLFSNKQIRRMIKQGYKKQDLLLRNRENKKALKETIKQFNHIDKSFFNNYELIYRTHPGTVLSDELPKEIKKINKYSVYDWFGSVDLNVSRLSTSLFESDLFGIPSVRYNPTDYPKQLVTFGVDEYYSIREITEIDDSLINNCYEKQIKNRSFEKYIGACDGNATENISKIVLEMLETSSEKEAIRFSHYKFRYIRKLISNKVIKYLIINDKKKAQKLFKSIKLFKNDIPYEWKENNGKK